MKEDTTPAAPAPEAKPVAEAAPATPVAVAAKPKKGKGGLIAGIIAGVVALGGGGAAAYFLLNNNGNSDPTATFNNFVSDLFAGEYNNIKFDGNFNAEGTEAKLAGEASIKDLRLKANVETSISGMDINGDAIIDNEDVYFKINNAEDLLSSLGMNQSMLSMLGLGEIANSWLHIGGAEITANISASYTDESNIVSCLASQNIEEAGKELSDIYRDNSFITLSKYEDGEAVKKNGDLYTLSINAEKQKAFSEAVKNSNFVKTANCQTQTSSLDKTFEDADLPIYVELNNNTVSRIYADNLDFNLEYPDSVNIEVPSDAVELNSLISKFGGLFGGSFGGSSFYGIEDIDDDDDDEVEPYGYPNIDDYSKFGDAYDDEDLEELQKQLEELEKYYSDFDY